MLIYPWATKIKKGVGMKVLGEMSSGLSSLVQVHGTILQQLRIHKNICQLWGYEKLMSMISYQNDSVCIYLDKLIMMMLRAEINFDLQNLNKLNIGQTVEEIFVSDRIMAETCRDLATRLSVISIQNIEIRQTLEEMVLLQGSYANSMSQQLELVRQMGTQLYLATRC
jgi:bacterioferritin